jgi:hypothetical protein
MTDVAVTGRAGSESERPEFNISGVQEAEQRLCRRQR